MALNFRKLHPLYGVEVVGVDVAKPVGDTIFAEIRAALDEHSLLLFRGLDMTDERQIAFSERFGQQSRRRHAFLPAIESRHQLRRIHPGRRQAYALSEGERAVPL